MGLKDGFQSGLTPAFYWRAALWSLCAVSLALLALLWLGGTDETEQALKGGRRLIIRLADGAIEGKTDAPPVPEGATASPTAETGTPTATQAASGTASATALREQSEITASETAQQAAAELALESGALKAAAIPLNPVKDALLEKIAIGNLPIIARDGTRPWRYYAKPFALKGTKPMIALVVTGLGQAKGVTQAALKLHENVSLSFSPYAKDATTWATSARAIGHEVLLDLPLEPTNYPAADPGPYGLLTSKSMGENAPRLHWVLSRMQGYIGLVTADNEAYSSNDEYWRPTLELLAARGLMLAMPHEPVRKETRTLLDESKIAYLLADTVVDEEMSESGIQMRLNGLEKIATKRGYAIGYAHAIPLSLAQLEAWIAALDERGFTLVPLSYVTALKFKK